MLVSYLDRALLSDLFVCACADEEAFKDRAEVLPLSSCDRMCPDDKV